MRKLLPLVVLAASALPRLASAQTVSLDVTVLDAASDLPLIAKTVALKNLDTGTELTDDTDALGVAHFGGLSTVGRWQASIEGTEESAAAYSPEIELRSQFKPNIILKVAKRADEPVYETVVKTTPGAFQLNRTNGEVSSTLRLRDVEKLPVEARSLDRALYRLPNVTQSTGFFAEAPVIAINGANALYTNYMIDGLDNNENFLGGMRFPVPVGMMQDVTVLAAGYSVEYGRTANGVVNVTSRGGTNEMKNEAFFVTRPGWIFSADLPGNKPYQLTSLYNNPVSSSFQRYQGGAISSGALVKDKTFYMVDIEYTADITENQLTSPQLGVNETLNGNNNYLLMSARFDHKLNSNWTLTLRGNHGRVELNSPGGGLSGGLTFPSAGSDQTRYSTNVAFTATRHGSSFDYVGSVQYSRFDWNYGRPKNGNGPQVTLRDGSGNVVGVVGNNGSFFDDTENTVQTKHVVTTKRGRHTLKGGADAIWAMFQLKSGGNPNGNFDVGLTDDQLAGIRSLNRGSGLDYRDIPGDAAVNSAIYEARPASFGKTQQLYGLFIEDSIQLTPTFVATFGVRWDIDSLSQAGASGPDLNNVAPRFSAAWSLSDEFVLRGSSGIFYEKIPYTVTSDALGGSSRDPRYLQQLQELKNQGVLPGNTNINRVTFNGNRPVSVPCTTLASCPSGADARAGFGGNYPAGYQELRIQNPNGLDNPYSWQSTLGAQWQFHPAFFFSVDFILSYGFNLVRLRDVNAPVAYDSVDGSVRTPGEANATRPTGYAAGAQVDGNARSIIMSETKGKSRYTAMTVTLYKQEWNDAFDFRVHYTLSRLMNNTDDLNFRATDSNRYTQEWGPSLNDRTHTVSAIVNVYPMEHLTLTAAALLQSGQPYNLTPAGTQDINGDGLSRSDQYTGNPDREPGESRNSRRLNWNGTFDVGAAYDIPINYTRLRIRADVFNVFNARNQSGYPVNYTVSNQLQQAGQPFRQTSTNMPRVAQFTLQWFF